MKTIILSGFAALLVIGGLVISVDEANAVTCVRGVYRAGCVGVHGAVVHRGVVYPHHGVVHRRVYVR